VWPRSALLMGAMRRRCGWVWSAQSSLRGCAKENSPADQHWTSGGLSLFRRLAYKLIPQTSTAASIKKRGPMVSWSGESSRFSITRRIGDDRWYRNSTSLITISHVGLLFRTIAGLWRRLRRFSAGRFCLAAGCALLILLVRVGNLIWLTDTIRKIRAFPRHYSVGIGKTACGLPRHTGPPQTPRRIRAYRASR